MIGSNGGPSVPEAIEIQLKKGVLEMCVLALLSQGDSYAYDIAARLAEDIGMGEGTIYPLMRRLQNDRLVETYLVESSAGPSRKYYRLTQLGTASLKTQKAAWASFAGAVQGILGGVK
jgi:PadR family transcriptional regulator PadR